MKHIETFKCIQKEIYGNGTEKILSDGICRIKTELFRPDIRILINDTFSKLNYKFTRRLHESTFSREELFFLSNIFNFELYKDKWLPEYLTTSISNLNELYKSSANIILAEDELFGKEFLVIEFNRWQYEYQPRGVGEDQLGENITYIHGIWGDLDLPESIINKIKMG